MQQIKKVTLCLIAALLLVPTHVGAAQAKLKTGWSTRAKVITGLVIAAAVIGVIAVNEAITKLREEGIRNEAMQQFARSTEGTTGYFEVVQQIKKRSMQAERQSRPSRSEYALTHMPPRRSPAPSATPLPPAQFTVDPRHEEPTVTITDVTND